MTASKSTTSIFLKPVCDSVAGVGPVQVTGSKARFGVPKISDESALVKSLADKIAAEAEVLTNWQSSGR